jgi:hypothetical protein
VMAVTNRPAGSVDAGARRKLKQLNQTTKRPARTRRISARRHRPTCQSHRPAQRKRRSHPVPTRIAAMTPKQPRNRLAHATRRQKSSVNRCHPLHLKTGLSPVMKRFANAACRGNHRPVTHPVTVIRFGLPVRAAATLRPTKGRDAMTDKQRL